MKQTAVEWLVSQILTDIEKYNDDCTAVVGFEYFNKFQSHVDLSEYIKQAKEMEKSQNKYFHDVGFYTGRSTDNDKNGYFEYWINNYKND